MNRSGNRRSPAPALLLGICMLGGCAAAPPPGSLAQLQADMTSKLAARCYWEHEGARYVAGGAPVWAACRRWAAQAVAARFAAVPESPPLRSAQR